MGSNPTLSATFSQRLDCSLRTRHNRAVRADRIVLGLGVVAVIFWFVVLLLGPFILAVLLRTST